MSSFPAVPVLFVNCLLLSVANSTFCYSQGPCNNGYMDQTNGTYYYWQCGWNCTGGKHYTNFGCGCACIPETSCSPTSNPTMTPTTSTTMFPTVNPSFYPTMNPTVDPTQSPTQNPTRNPTPIPTKISKMHTLGPTLKPTVQPTLSSTIDPTENPSMNLTLNPSLSPSITPSIPPSTSPTFEPSVEPTIEPSFIPTLNPTLYHSTTSMEYVQSMNYTVSITVDDHSESVHVLNETQIVSIVSNALNIENDDIHSVEVQNGTIILQITIPIDSDQDAESITTSIVNGLREEYGDDVTIIVIVTLIVTSSSDSNSNSTNTNHSLFDQLELNHFTVIGGIVSLFVVFICTACLDAYCIRKNDYFRRDALIIALLGFLDVVTDVLFSNTVTTQYMEYKKEEEGDMMLGVMCLIAWTSIGVPVLLSLLQMIRMTRREWERKESVKGWIFRHSFVFYSLPLLCGSAFNAVAILNSNAFQVDIFSMDLSESELSRFRVQRIWSIVFFENLPQVALQTWFLLEHEATAHEITTAALLFSLISIVLTILAVCTQRRIARNQQRIVITFTVVMIGHGNRKQKLHLRTEGIRRDIASLLDIDYHLVEIEKPRGLKFRVIINMNNVYYLDKDYKAMIETATSDGTFGEFFRDHWDLKEAPFLKDFEYTEMLSEVQESNRINIVASNSDASHLIMHSEMSSEANDDPFDDIFDDIEMEGMATRQETGIDGLQCLSVSTERGESEGVLITTRYHDKMQGSECVQ